MLPIVPDGAGPALREHPIGTGPYRFVRYDVDDQVELAAFDDYFGGRPRNDGLVLKIVPDDIMRGLELRKGTIDSSSTIVAPDIVYQLGQRSGAAACRGAGRGLSVRRAEPARSRPAGRARAPGAWPTRSTAQAIVEYLRRGLAAPAAGLLPPLSWAFAPDVFTFPYDPARARALLDEAGYPRPDGDGPAARFRLTLKVVEHRVQPPAVVGDPAEPARRRHRARRAHLRVRDAVRRRA